ncbi:hypothetical protein [Luteolibacter soli]|uniref:Uncharacterized protein n=1 Tax=Luteolibacter soli TaxID=3135280 RepID=A0ABU9B629_9BACT
MRLNLFALTLVTLTFQLVSCSTSREEGAWDYRSVRIPYNLPLDRPVTVGMMYEAKDNRRVQFGDCVPLSASRGSDVWKKVFDSERSDVPYEREVSDRDSVMILRHLGLRRDTLKKVGNLVVRASGRRVEAITDRLLLESLLNSTEFPLGEIESIHDRVERGQLLEIVLLEEVASSVTFGIHTKHAEEVSKELQSSLVLRKRSLDIKSFSCDVENDLVSVRLRGEIVIRRLLGKFQSGNSRGLSIISAIDARE